MEPLTSSFWANEAALLYAVVFDVVEEAARRGVLNAAQGIIQQLLRIGLPEPDYDLLNESAYRYAERHTFELVSGITDTSKRALQREFAEWIESGEPLPKLVERIKPLYGPVRANMIAVTGKPAPMPTATSWPGASWAWMRRNGRRQSMKTCARYARPSMGRNTS